ncbi:MAG: PorV/PorQ family protein [Bacteroidota bacterium]
MSKFLLILAAACVFAAQFAVAQTKTGTTIGQFLLIEPSGKIAAMGNAGVAQFDEAMASYYNPAALGHMITSGAQFTHNTWFAGITLEYFTAALRVSETSSLSLSISSLNSGEIAVRTVEQPLGTGEQYTVSDYAIGIGFGQKITDRFSAGVQLSYIQETIWHSNLSVFAFNFGTLYQISDDGIQLGASLSNFGMRGKYNGRDLRLRFDLDPARNGDNSSLPAEILTEEFSLPVVFRVGFGIPVKLGEGNEIHFVVDASHPSDNSESVSFGAEYKFMDAFAIRGGYQHLFQTDSEVGLTLGGGIEWDIARYILHVDYSWNEHEHLGDTQRMTVGMEF